MNPSRSHAAYRLAWDNSSSERIPYIPLSLRDLTTAEQGNPTFIGDEQTGRINWKKFEVMGEVIVGLQKAQGLPYRGLGNGRMGEQARELVMDVKLVKDEEVSLSCLRVAVFRCSDRFMYCEPVANISFAPGTIRTQHVHRAHCHPRRKHYRQNPQLLPKLRDIRHQRASMIDFTVTRHENDRKGEQISEEVEAKLQSSLCRRDYTDYKLEMHWTRYDWK